MNVCPECSRFLAMVSHAAGCSRKGGAELASLDPLVQRDIQWVIAFVLGSFPGYEDEIAWGDDLKGEDYYWFRAARRLRERLTNEPLTGGEVEEAFDWLTSCDNCACQEDGGHYCLLYSRPMKNMNLTRCADWTEKKEAKQGRDGGINAAGRTGCGVAKGGGGA